MEVNKVDFDPSAGTPFVLLEDQSTQRALPIWIGPAEARAIMLKLHGIEPPRPQTSDLLRRLIKQTGHQVDYVVISKLRGVTYYADICLDHCRYRIDSRPSDAIALALGAGVPIYVAARLFNQRNTVDLIGGHKIPSIAHGLGATVQDVTPEMTRFFSVQPGAGVVVSDAQGDVARAGVQSGDVIVKVGGREITNVKDFSHSLAQLQSSDEVQLTVIRASKRMVLTVRPPLDAGSLR